MEYGGVSIRRAYYRKSRRVEWSVGFRRFKNPLISSLLFGPRWPIRIDSEIRAVARASPSAQSISPLGQGRSSV